VTAALKREEIGFHRRRVRVVSGGQWTLVLS
jgi:hypothetical protein